jgi:hypothetical protein
MQILSPRKTPLRSLGVSIVARVKRVLEDALDLLWRFIGWVWGSVVVSMILAGIVGSAAYSYLTHGQFDPVDLPHLPLVSWIETHALTAILFLCCLVALTVSAFFVHRNKQKAMALAPLINAHTLQKVERLDPHNFKLVHYVQRAYISRDADTQVRQTLHKLADSGDPLDKATLGICIIGRPAQGKTRLAWEAMQEELPGWTLVR